MVQAVAQKTPAHAGYAIIEQGKQGRRALPAQGFGQFEIAPRRRIQPKINAFFLDDEVLHMRQGARLRVFGILQQCAGGGDGEFCCVIFNPERGERMDMEMLAQHEAGVIGGKMPLRSTGLRDGRGTTRNTRQGDVQPFRQKHFRRANALQRRGKLRGGDFRQHEFAAGEIQPRQPDLLAVLRQRHEQRILAVFHQTGVGQRAGRDDTRHHARHRPLAIRIARLLANHHRLAQFDEAGKIIFQRVIGNPRHLDRLPRRLPARGEGNVQ